jgi:hypothetical protein
MPNSEKQIDEKKGDEVLRRMLKTTPGPHVKPRESNRGVETKPSGTPAKKHRPEEDS